MSISTASKAILTKLTNARETRAEQARIRKMEPYAPGRVLAHPCADTTTAYWLLNDVRTQGRHPAQIDQMIRSLAAMWTGLAGERFVIHMWHTKFDGAAFRKAQEREFPNAAPGAIDADVRLATNAKWGAARWNAVLGVEVADHAVAREDIHLCEPGTPLPDNKRAYAAVQEKLERLDQHLADYGTPRGPRQISDMWREFTRMGMPCDVTPSADAFQPNVTLTGLYEGDRAERFVPVLRVADVPEVVDTATSTPWLQWFGALAGDVYVVVQGRVTEGRALRSNAELKNRENRSHARADREAGYDARPVVEKGEASAKRYRADVNSTDTARSTHIYYAVKVALPRDTHADAVKAVRDVTKQADTHVRVVLEHGLGQYDDWASLAPGRRWRLDSHVNQGNALSFTASFPNASNLAGSDVGLVAGPIHGSRGIAVLDMRDGMRAKASGQERAATAVVTGAPGTGKSTLAAVAGWDEHQKGGGVFATDPSSDSSLARVALAVKGRVVPLTTQSPPGALMPSITIPDPIFFDGQTPEEHAAAVEEAAAGRVELWETLVAAVAYSVENLPGFREAITIACTDMGAYGIHAREVIEALASIDTQAAEVAEAGQRIATVLRAKAGSLEGRLIFPDVDVDVDVDKITDLVASSRFTVVTMPGLEVPEGDRSAWTPGMFRAVPVMIGAARLTELALWAPGSPVSMVINDELGITLAGSSAMSSQISRTFYAIRKLGKVAFFISQTLAPFGRLGDDAIKDIAGMTFTSAVSGQNAAEVAEYMDLCPKHVAALPMLRSGEFIANLPGATGVRFNLELNRSMPPAVRAALSTTPVQEATTMDTLWSWTAKAVTQ